MRKGEKEKETIGYLVYPRNHQGTDRKKTRYFLSPPPLHWGKED